MKTILLIVGVVVLVLLAAAGGFYGGMTYQSNQVNQVRANFEQARGAFTQGQFTPRNFNSDGTGGPPAGFGQGFRGGGVSGQVKSLDGDILTLSTAEDVTTVNLSENTRILKNAVVSLDELLPGTRVMVTGESGSDGEIDALQIMILDNASAPLGSEPGPAGETPEEGQP